MINLLILVALLLLITLRYKQGFIVFASFFFFTRSLESGIGGITIYFIVACYLYLIFLYRKFTSKDLPVTPFPKTWKVSIAIITICCLITEKVSGFGNYAGWVNWVVTSFVFPFLLWNFLNCPSRIISLIKALCLSLVIVVGYAFIEQAIHVNPIANLLYPSDDPQYVIQELSESAFRYGLYRCKSVLVFSSTLGCFGLTIGYLLFQFKHYTSFFLYHRKGIYRYKPLLLLAFVSIIFSLTRSVFLVTTIVLAGAFLQYRQMRSKSNLIVFATLLVFLLLFFVGDGMAFIDSYINRMNDENIGSSPELRMNQLDICLYYFDKAPIWGNGLNYIYKVVAINDPKIYGAESIWFQLLVNYGIVGCITYILFVLSIIIVLWKYNRYLIFFPLAIFIGKTSSILMDVWYDYYLYVAILIIKIQQHKQQLV